MKAAEAGLMVPSIWMDTTLWDRDRKGVNNMKNKHLLFIRKFYHIKRSYRIHHFFLVETGILAGKARCKSVQEPNYCVSVNVIKFTEIREQ